MVDVNEELEVFEKIHKKNSGWVEEVTPNETVYSPDQ